MNPQSVSCVFFVFFITNAVKTVSKHYKLVQVICEKCKCKIQYNAMTEY